MIAAEHRRVYPTDCTSSRRPLYQTEEPVFCRCPVCGMVQVRNRPVGALAVGAEEMGQCCGRRLERLVPQEAGTGGADHEMQFCVFGGSSHNVIRIEVDGGRHPMTEDHRIEWIYLRTFQGGQMKYLPLRSGAATLFSMANEDAFVFCDREVCRMGWEHCLFQCKRGHAAYAYCSQHGLYQLTF